jgi:hypothetical protein
MNFSRIIEQLFYNPWSDYADFGDSESIQETYGDGDYSRQYEKYETYLKYYTGRIFDTRDFTAQDLNTGDAPLIYPVGLNMVKMICNAQADTLWGEWDTIPFRVFVQPPPNSREGSEAGVKTAQILTDMAMAIIDNTPHQTWWEAGNESMYMGGAFLKLAYNPVAWPHIRISRISPVFVEPVFHPTEMGRLIEVRLPKLDDNDGVDPLESPLLHRIANRSQAE